MDLLPNGFEELCEEDKILVFFERLLDGWRQELGGTRVALFNQCARNLGPLFGLCRNKVLPDDIREALLGIVGCCMNRDYVAATDRYFRVSISNTPWPVGVTMAGIHEHSAREKIRAGSVAHGMNNDTTLRYLQSIRKLMIFCERHYPALP